MVFKKGIIPWNKGKTNVYTKEVLENMSLAKTGKPSKQKGSKRSLATRAKMSKAKTALIKTGWVPGKPFPKGNPSWCKGLTKETDERLRKISEKMKGREFTPEWLEKMSLAKKGKPSLKKGIPSGKKGQVKNPDLHIRRWFAKLPMRVESEKIKWWVSYKRSGKNNSFYGRKHSEETHKKFANKKKGPFKDTKPEKMMQIALSLNNIKFQKHKPFKLGKRWHQVDIFIEPNICIEVDGLRWHMPMDRIKRDLFQTQELTVMGYHVIRIRDKDILKNTQGCAEKVIQLIKELQHRYSFTG